jgi:hypothetical protein
LQKKIQETTDAIAEVRQLKKVEEDELSKLNAEFGDEVIM